MAGPVQVMASPCGTKPFSTGPTVSMPKGSKGEFNLCSAHRVMRLTWAAVRDDGVRVAWLVTGTTAEVHHASALVHRSQLLRRAATGAAALVLSGQSGAGRSADAAIIEEDAAQRLYESVGACCTSVHIRLANGEGEA